ncbi:MAG: TonB-dependent receptor [Deltaproteobacteria bacterium]|nr:TonB-dependent receptor [Deltaproteobacteria bacterium]
MNRNSQLTLFIALPLACTFAGTFDVRAQEDEKAIQYKDVNDTELVEMELEELLAIQVVETVSLRKQSIREAPSSVTVITREQIETSGAQNIAELLRLVPGIHVMQLTGDSYSIGQRGISRLSNGRVLVLVDGTHAREYVNGYTRFSALAVSPEDVQRIEVIRGPGSVIYGAGALSGVVNVITRDIPSTSQTEVSANGGLNAVQRSGGRWWQETWGNSRVVYSSRNRTETMGYRFGASFSDSPEWPNDELPDTALAQNQPITGPSAYALQSQVTYQPTQKLDIDLTLSNVHYENVGFSDISNFSITQSTNSVSATLELNRAELVWPNLDFSIALAGTHISSEFTRTDVNARNMKTNSLRSLSKLLLSTFADHNITTFAYENILSRTSEFFFLPDMIAHGIILNNDLFLIDRKLLLSLAGRYDQILSRESDFGNITYRVFTYRAAGIWSFNEDHAVRITGSSSFRPPGPVETFMNVQPTDIASSVPEGAPPPRYIVGNPQLRPEKLNNIEVGYQGRWRKQFQADLSVYGQDVTDLTENNRANALPVFKVNRFNYQQLGMELGLTYKPSNQFSTYLNYSFVYSSDTESHRRIREFPAHIGGIGARLSPAPHTRINVDTYWVFDYSPDVSQLIPDSEPPVSIVANEKAADQMVVNIRLGRLLWNDQIEIFIAGKNLLAPLRDPNQLRMYPIYAAQPIGTTMFIGLNLTAN